MDRSALAIRPTARSHRPKINREGAKSAKVRDGAHPQRPVPWRIFVGFAVAYLGVLRAFAVDLWMFPQAVWLKGEPRHQGCHATASDIGANAIALTALVDGIHPTV
jgi:hypothetical protein